MPNIGLYTIYGATYKDVNREGGHTVGSGAVTAINE